MQIPNIPIYRREQGNRERYTGKCTRVFVFPIAMKIQVSMCRKCGCVIFNHAGTHEQAATFVVSTLSHAPNRKQPSPERMAPGTRSSRVFLLLLASSCCGGEAFALSRALHLGHQQRAQAAGLVCGGGSGRGEGRRGRSASWTRSIVGMSAADTGANLVGECGPRRYDAVCWCVCMTTSPRLRRT